MDHPLIGITTYRGRNNEKLPITALLNAYVDAISTAGGIPVLIPSILDEEMTLELYAHCDGILFTGGGDVAIDRFGGEPHPRVNKVDLQRDNIEILLLKNLIQDQKPFLGICRGFQMINIGLGGTLYTHIADQKKGALKHDYYPKYPRTLLAHKVIISNASQLANILGEKELSVNSLHHQGAKEISAKLNPVAYSPDGLVEAIELPNHPFGIAVQWHPEWLMDQKVTRQLFRAFIDAAGGNS